MKKQPHSHKKIEHQRGLYFRIGLAVSLFITFLAFEWETKLPRYEFPVDLVDSVDYEPIIYTWSNPEKPIPEPKVEKKQNKKLKDFIDMELKIVPDETPFNNLVINSIDPSELNPVVPKPEPFYDDNEVKYGAEKMPYYYGGDSALFKFIRDNTRFPGIAIQNGLDGLVHISFVIDKDGSVTNVETKYASSKVFENEAIRVIKLMPAWQPATQGGIPVRVQMSLPISFKLK